MKHKAVPEKDSDGNNIITVKYLKKLCFEQELYDTPHLNDKLYLHYKAFHKIENLDLYVNLKALWLECNGIRKIEGLDHLAQLRTLFLHQNCIEKIEGLDNLKELVTLNLANNRIRKIENLEALPNLKNLDISHNCIETTDNMHGLNECPSLTSVDLSNNYIESEDGFLEFISTLNNIICIYFRSNPIVRKISNYRKRLIVSMPSLRYLDDKPVFEIDRLCAEAWMKGGPTEELKVRGEYLQEKRRKERADVQNLLGYEEEAKRKQKMALERIDRQARARQIELEERRNELRRLIDEGKDTDPEYKRNILKLKKTEFDITENLKIFEDDTEKSIVPSAIKPLSYLPSHNKENESNYANEEEKQKEAEKQNEEKEKYNRLVKIQEYEDKLADEAKENKENNMNAVNEEEQRYFKWDKKYEDILEKVLMSNMFDFLQSAIDFKKIILEDFPADEFNINAKNLQLKWTDIEIRKYRMGDKQEQKIENEDDNQANNNGVSYYNNLEDID